MDALLKVIFVLFLLAMYNAALNGCASGVGATQPCFISPGQQGCQ